MALNVQSATNVGRQRSVNEDDVATVLLAEGEWCLVVCDGMGGQEGGQLASRTAVAHIVRWIQERCDEPDPAPVIREALLGASEAVAVAAVASGVPSAGSTAVVAWTRGNQLWMGWVGDSRYYRFQGRAINGRSKDHTRVAEMLSHGILTEAEAKVHPDAHILTRALGGGRGLAEAGGPDGWNQPQVLEPGDTVLLCSDGLFDLVSDEEIPELMSGCDLPTACSRLVDAANERGGHDNITVIVAVWDRVTVPALPAAPRVVPQPPPASLAPERPFSAQPLPVRSASAGSARAPAPAMPVRPPATSVRPGFVQLRPMEIGLGIMGCLILGAIGGFELCRRWPPPARAAIVAPTPEPSAASLDAATKADAGASKVDDAAKQASEAATSANTDAKANEAGASANTDAKANEAGTSAGTDAKASKAATSANTDAKANEAATSAKQAPAPKPAAAQEPKLNP